VLVELSGTDEHHCRRWPFTTVLGVRR
jgi:hypothetical protein